MPNCYHIHIATDSMLFVVVSSVFVTKITMHPEYLQLDTFQIVFVWKDKHASMVWRNKAKVKLSHCKKKKKNVNTVYEMPNKSISV